MRIGRTIAWVSTRLLLGSLPILGQSAQTPTEHHHTGVDTRGDHVMGFGHAETTHHFRLTPSGGAIEVTVKDAADTKSRNAIRGHLAEIAQKFSMGDFEAPMLIHDRVPPGVPTLQEGKDSVRWTYQDIQGGGRIRIQTKDSKALAAVHDFLRFQIEDHRTGDSTKIGK